VIFVGTVLLLLAYPAIVVRKYVRILINLLDDHAPANVNGNGNGNGHGNGNGDAVFRAGEDVRFRAVDGHLLEGVVLGGAKYQPSKGMIIFAHEVGSDRRSGFRYCRPLLDAGFDVFLFDFRGHGMSAPEEGYRPRQWPSDREQADMLGAIAFAGSYLEQRGRPRDVGLFGISRGGGAAILASVGLDSVKAILVDGAFSSDCTLEYLMKRFAATFARIRIVARNHPPVVWRFFRWAAFRECQRRFRCRYPSVRKALARLGRKPILFVHGEKDSYIPISQSQSLYELSDGPKSLWIVPGAKHNQSILVAPDAYSRRAVLFFGKYLAGDSNDEIIASSRSAHARYDVPSFETARPGSRSHAVVERASVE